MLYLSIHLSIYIYIYIYIYIKLNSYLVRAKLYALERKEALISVGVADVRSVTILRKLNHFQAQ